MDSSDRGEALVPFRCDLKSGDKVDGKYVVDSELGKGSFGQVFKVFDLKEKPYALKILRLWEVPSNIRDTLLERFRAEYKIARIVSPYLVKSIEFGSMNNNPYFVMEYCGGGDVNALMGGDYDRVLEVARQILLGLDALHAKGIVHRDIKPENILLREDGSVAITDFGISGNKNHRMTERNWFGRPSQMFGTYAYMPPEQIYRKRGDSTVLPTTDIFSFGVLLYQLLTGELPYGTIENHSELVTYQKNIKEGAWNRSALSKIPDIKRWIRVFEKCLNPDYLKRYQTIKELLTAIPFKDCVQPPSSGNENEPEVSDSFDKHFCLVVERGEEEGRSYDLTEMFLTTGRNSLLAGRGSSNDIHLKDSEATLVSRRHFTILTTDAQTWIVRDGQYDSERRGWRNSLNGTYINDRICGSQGSYIQEGDLIQVGDVKLKLIRKEIKLKLIVIRNHN